METNQENQSFLSKFKSKRFASNFILGSLIFVGIAAYLINSSKASTIQETAQQNFLKYLKYDTIEQSINVQFGEIQSTMLKFSQTKASDSLFSVKDSLLSKQYKCIKKCSEEQLNCFGIKNVKEYRECLETANKNDSTLFYHNKMKDLNNYLNHLDSIKPLTPGYSMDIYLSIDDIRNYEQINSVWTIFFDQNLNVTSNTQRQ